LTKHSADIDGAAPMSDAARAVLLRTVSASIARLALAERFFKKRRFLSVFQGHCCNFCQSLAVQDAS
jgi:hypothetical protein